LPSRLKDELEDILHFNLNQSKHLLQIVKNIEKYGNVTIQREKDNIYISIDNEIRHNELYALDSLLEQGHLLGVLIYCINDDICEVIHVAVHHECAHKGCFADEYITLRLLEKLRKTALNLARVNKIRLPYTNILLLKNVLIMDVFE
jgi:N-acetylglutamate synthase-like GNAT family acetyltransferase